MGPIRNPNWSTSGMRVTLSYLSDTVLREMLIEATFNQTNFWLIFFSILWHKVWVLVYNMFIFEKVGHSKFVEMHGDTSDYFRSASKSDRYFLAHLTQRGHVSYCHHWASVVRPLTFHILINSSEATGPIWTKLWWNGPWMVPFQNCVRWSRLPTKMAAKLKIEKRGDEILIVHCCFSISQNGKE